MNNGYYLRYKVDPIAGHWLTVWYGRWAQPGMVAVGTFAVGSQLGNCGKGKVPIPVTSSSLFSVHLILVTSSVSPSNSPIFSTFSAESWQRQLQVQWARQFPSVNECTLLLSMHLKVYYDVPAPTSNHNQWSLFILAHYKYTRSGVVPGQIYYIASDV